MHNNFSEATFLAPNNNSNNILKYQYKKISLTRKLIQATLIYRNHYRYTYKNI